MQIAITVFAALVLVYIIYKWISTYIKNERSPVVNTRAQVVDKRSDFHTATAADGVTATSETLYLVFRLDSGSDLALAVPRRVYREVPLYEWGMLTFQGTRFIQFQSHFGTVAK